MELSSWLSLVVGTSLVLTMLVDLFVTVFLISGGAGPVSGRLAERLWRGALRLHRTDSRRSHSLMRAAGPAIVFAVILLWVVQLTLGWALVFVPEAFAAEREVGFTGRLAFASSAVLGRGGNRPQLETDQGWELLHSVAGLTGVTLVSLSLAYLLPIIGAVVHKRSIAATVTALGDTVDAMRTTAATAGGGSFELHLIALTPALSWSAERHRAYPVLHYFHSRDRHAALAPAAARLVLLLGHRMPQAEKVDATVVRPLGRALHNLMGALCEMGLADHARRSDGVDRTTIDATGLAPQDEGDRGPLPAVSLMRSYVRFDGWDWQDVADGDHGIEAGP